MARPTRDGPEWPLGAPVHRPAPGRAVTVLVTDDPLEVSLSGGTERAVAHVSGEIIFDNAGRLLDVLSQAALAGPAGLDVDTTGVTFTDSSGLNALLELRTRALAAGRQLTLRPGACVGRLLDLTGTRGVFAPATETSDDATDREP
ncbi:STAS domain-containing protein [Kitasatospora sp. NPDC101801]|uniref:STAS domain-containing protein n=1 Tax=Kitasatospora sp. NPDC101801 TaxID=3364103 RepID=UPI003824EC69